MINNFKFGVVGQAISYSLSPAIFEAIFEIAGIEGECCLFDVEDDLFDEGLPKIFDYADGISVTMPYKTRIINFLDEVDPIAQTINAVNSIRIVDGKTKGYNTDCSGFSFPLMPLINSDNIKTVLLLGNGGAAKAVGYALTHHLSCEEIIVAGRNEENTKKFVDSFEDNAKFETVLSDRIDQPLLDRCDLIVNSTPLGGANNPDKLPLDEKLHLSDNTIYYDLNYNDNNRMLQIYRHRGLKVIDGSIMLIAQAIKSFELWTGMKIDFDLLYHKVFKDDRK